MTTGVRVLVRGTRSGQTVTATTVFVLPAGGFGIGGPRGAAIAPGTGIAGGTGG